jgi:tRNA pseudouridine55 synthase
MLHGVLVVDKPSGPTSHDVVQRVRRVFGTRAVGHAGTLDPMASGVLVLGLGEATKLLHHLSGVDKSYLATVTLGVETDSLDAQGKAVESAPVPTDLNRETVMRIAATFEGEQLQRVPEISAVKQQGTPLYQRARRGEQVVAPERVVHVRELEVLRVAEDADRAEIDLRVTCSKGFYVRALARDLARALGSVGHLTQLRRTVSGAFSLADALAWEQLQLEPTVRQPMRDREQALRDNPLPAVLSAALMPLRAALRGLPSCVLTAQGVLEIRQGRPVRAEHLSTPSWPALGVFPVGLLDEQGRVCALGRAEADQILVMRGIWDA